MRRALFGLLAFFAAFACLPADAQADVSVQAYALPSGGGYPHDVAVGSDGIVWYTAQRDGKLGRLDPATGRWSWCRWAPTPPRTASSSGPTARRG